MKAKKKILSLALIACLAAVAIVGSSLAYFTDKDDATNVISIGNVDIELTEPGWDRTGEEEAETMYPGEAVAKDPTITNYGENPAFVRISIEWPEDVSLSYRTDYVDGKLGDNWVEHDGYYYYYGILEKGDSTDALFDQIVLSSDTTNGDATEKNIVVHAEAIQAQGAAVQWSRVQTMTVEEIENWFNTQSQIPYGA